MGDVQHGIVAGDQASGDERIGHGAFVGREVVAVRAAAGRFAVLQGHEFQQCGEHRRVRVGRTQVGGDPVRVFGQCPSDPAQATVVVLRHRPTRADPQEELLKGVRQQRQCVPAFCVVHHPGHAPGSEAQGRLFCGLLDHFEQFCAAEHTDQRRLVNQRGVCGSQEVGKEIRSQGGHHPQMRIRRKRLIDQRENRAVRSRSRHRRMPADPWASSVWTCSTVISGSTAATLDAKPTSGSAPGANAGVITHRPAAASGRAVAPPAPARTYHSRRDRLPRRTGAHGPGRTD